MLRVVLLLFAFACLPAPLHAEDNDVHRYLYLAGPDGAQPGTSSGEGLLVFDIDAGFKFVRRIENANLAGGVRGLTGCLATHGLYYSTTDHRLGRFDLETGMVLWDNRFSGGCDRSCVTLDGKRIYAPTGFWETGDGGLVVVDGNTGAEIRRIPVGKGAHNSIVSLDGSRIFLGTTTTLTIIDAADEHVLKTIPDVGESGVFPFTVNHDLTLAYVCLGKHAGFDVVDLVQGKPIHRVLAGDAPITHRTHGVALTPDEKELWICDPTGEKLYIYDATRMPPAPKGEVPLGTGGHGWVNFSLDGNYAWCHTPDVFDAHTRKQIATLRDETGKPVASSKLIEVHFKDGKVVAMGSEFGLGRAAETKSQLESDPQGWEDILPSADLEGWYRVPVPPTGRLGRAQWYVDADKKLLVCDGDGGHDMLLFDREIGDAVFHFEFRYPKTEGETGYNSGAYVRNSKDGGVWHQAQFGDASGGFLFGRTSPSDVPATRFSLSKQVRDSRVKPAGEWNTMELTASGKLLTLWVNGSVTCRFEDCERPDGYLGVEAEGCRIEFRNLKVKPLHEAALRPHRQVEANPLRSQRTR